MGKKCPSRLLGRLLDREVVDDRLPLQPQRDHLGVERLDDLAQLLVAGVGERLDPRVDAALVEVIALPDVEVDEALHLLRRRQRHQLLRRRRARPP